MFVIEDEAHADWVGEYAIFEDAIAELRRRAGMPSDEAPNVAPCTSWRTCGRRYQILEYDTSTAPWKQLRCMPAQNISSRETTWLVDPDLAPQT
jgi:hypothetical protein